MHILNLTQHEATADQLKAGVFEPKNKDRVKALLTFNSLPNKDLIYVTAEVLAAIACKDLDKRSTKVMIDGAPFLMGALENALKDNGLTPVYAFSECIMEEVSDGNGGVRKTNVLVHVGFVEV